MAAFHRSHRAKDQTSADGGRFSKIDDMMEVAGGGYNHQDNCEVGMTGIAEHVGSACEHHKSKKD
jgi:hypothetical protein